MFQIPNGRAPEFSTFLGLLSVLFLTEWKPALAPAMRAITFGVSKFARPMTHSALNLHSRDLTFIVRCRDSVAKTKR
jgi:hypothetical protein